MASTELPTIEVPNASQWPGAVALWQHSGGSGRIRVAIDLIRGTGRRDAVPELELRYDGTQVNGPFGMGWSLAIPSIVRGNGRRLPRYRDEGPEADPFSTTEFGELIPARVRGLGGEWQDDRPSDARWNILRFRPRNEGAFVRVEQRTERVSGDMHWRVISRDNVTRIFGRSAEARIVDPADPRRVAQWLLEEQWDSQGHGVRFEYKRENLTGVTPSMLYERHRLASHLPDAVLYPKRMKWGNRRPFVGDEGWLFELVFDYGEHDPLLPQPEEDAERSWDLRSDAFSHYRTGFEMRTRRLCRRVLRFHRMPELGGPCLVRAHELRYEQIAGSSVLTGVRLSCCRRMDSGVVVEQPLPETRFDYAPLLPPGPIRELRCKDGSTAAGAVAAQMSWLDLENNSLPGLVTRDSGGALHYRANLGGGLLDSPIRLPRRPSLTDTAAPSAQDIGKPFGDGRSCLVDLLRGPGFQERMQGGAWLPYRPFRSAPTVRASRAGTRSLDLDGDGLPDLMLTGTSGPRCHSFSGRAGWAAAQEVTATPSVQTALADQTGTVLLADMTGDGLADLVQVRPGRVRYWPNLGHGSFGEPVEMSGSPPLERPDLFDPRRVRLADLRGSGTADLLYLGREGVVWHRNQNGNSFGPGERLTRLPPLTDLESIDVVDLLGNGTGCLVWSSVSPGQSARPLRYAELQPGVPARTLVQVRNGMGLEVTITHSPSTRLMQEDRAAGRPWRGASPNPTWLVTELRETDRTSGVTRLSSWRYRHAHFDEAERESAGFAYIERREQTLLPPDPVDVRLSPDPPMRETRTWFHPGTPEGHDALATWMPGEFFHSDADLPTRPELEFENEAGAARIQLLRALRGQPLRQEVYEVGSDGANPVPLVMTEFGYVIRALQPGVDRTERAESIPPVVAAIRQEQLERVYEAQAEDPRVTQELALEIDRVGNVVRSMRTAYPRRHPMEPEQARPRVRATLREFRNEEGHADWYRVGIGIREASWELGSVPLPGGEGLPRRADFLRWLAESERNELPPGQGPLPATGPVSRRLTELSERIFWSDDLGSEQPFGGVGRRALVHHERHVAFSIEMLDRVYGMGTLGLSPLEEHGYQLDRGFWWARGPVVRYDASAFFQPVSATSFRGGEQSVRYDAHHLLVEQVLDPVGNELRAVADYQSLAPRSVADPNGTTTSTEFDALGLPTAIAIAGPDGEGDTLADPTTRIVRELDRWGAIGAPVSLRISSRSRHQDPVTLWRQTVTFFDGWGESLQQKQLAEPELETAPDRWVLSNFAIRSASGIAAREYVPVFVGDDAYSTEAALGRALVQRTREDALGRPILQRRSDGAIATTRYTPWLIERWDFNDAVRESDWLAQRRRADASASERAEAAAAAAHAETPSREHLDPSARVFLQVADGGALGPIPTRLQLGTTGDPVAVIDPRGVRTEERVYDMLGRPLQVRSAAAGETRTFYDAEDHPVILWGARGQRQTLMRDRAGRLTTREIQSADGTRRLAELLIWGEATHPRGAYRRGRPYLHYDASGEQKFVAYDFKGNLTDAQRTLRQDLTTPADWRLLLGASDVADIERRTLPLLSSDRRFAFQTEFDADGRIVARTLPDGSRLESEYQARGLRASVSATIDGVTTRVLASAQYDAEGRLREARLGNGSSERSEYDRGSGFLSRILTAVRGDALRDLSIQRDAVGNVLQVDDRSQQTRYFGNREISPQRAFTYDALYRLTSASGREADLPVAPLDRGSLPPIFPLAHLSDRARVRPFTERYRYDSAGNMLELAHRAGPSGSWTQQFDIDPIADRITALRDGRGDLVSGAFAYNEAGNPRQLGGLSGLVWDDDERLIQVDLGGGGTAHYVYDSSGARVGKVIVRLGGAREEHLSLGDYERERRYTAAGVVEKETTTVQVTTEFGRLAVLERRDDPGTGTTLHVWRYQHHDQVGSTALETDEAGEVLSFEEYRPFGATAYQASMPVSLPKRFRFGGQDHDAETGLGRFGLRLYAPWLCRWISPDPTGMADGTNRYAYCTNNPTTLGDPDGTQARIRFPQQGTEIEIPAEFTGPEFTGRATSITTPTRDTVSVSVYPRGCGPPECNEPVFEEINSIIRRPGHGGTSSHSHSREAHARSRSASPPTESRGTTTAPTSPAPPPPVDLTNPIEAERWAARLPAPPPPPTAAPPRTTTGSFWSRPAPPALQLAVGFLGGYARSVAAPFLPFYQLYQSYQTVENIRQSGAEAAAGMAVGAIPVVGPVLGIAESARNTLRFYERGDYVRAGESLEQTVEGVAGIFAGAGATRPGRGTRFRNILLPSHPEGTPARAAPHRIGGSATDRGYTVLSVENWSEMSEHAQWATLNAVSMMDDVAIGNGGLVHRGSYGSRTHPDYRLSTQAARRFQEDFRQMLSEAGVLWPYDERPGGGSYVVAHTPDFGQGWPYQRTMVPSRGVPTPAVSGPFALLPPRVNGRFRGASIAFEAGYVHEGFSLVDAWTGRWLFVSRALPYNQSAATVLPRSTRVQLWGERRTGP